jgi:hypothetical protein
MAGFFENLSNTVVQRAAEADALASRIAAAASEASALVSKDAAAASAVQAGSSATSSASDVNTTAASATASEVSNQASLAAKAAALIAQAAAETAEGNAAGSESNSAASSTSAAASATASEASKVISGTSAATATTKAAESAASAVNAAASAATTTSISNASETARAASVVAKDASVAAKDAAVVAKDASVVAKTASETAATNSAASETAAGNSATGSSNSATASSNSATASANSATASESSKVTSVNSAAAAATSETNAATSETNAAASYDLFDDRMLGAKSSAPTVDNDGAALVQGTLYFDTSSQTMKVYGSSGWVPAGSSVNGTAARFKFVATANQTTFSGNDAASNSLAYDAGFLDVYLSGIKLVNGTDFTASSGTSIVLAAGVAVNEILEIIAYGTFVLANFNADKLDGQHGAYYTAYADTAVANLVDSSPATLNTLNELAAALGDDPSFASSTATSIGLKAPIASPTFTGTATIPTADINAGTIDGTVIGAATPAAISGTTGTFSSTVRATGTTVTSAPSATLSFSGTTSRLESRGADVSTRGAIQLMQATSNGSSEIVALGFDAAGTATFNAGVNIGGNSNFLAPNINITADDARLVVQEADGTNMVWLGDLTGGGVGGCFLYNHGGTAVVQLRSDSASTIGHGLNVDGNVGIGISAVNTTYGASHALQIASITDNNWSGTLILSSADGTSVFSRLAASTNGFDLINTKNTNMRFFTNNIKRMTIHNDTKVEFGTFSNTGGTAGMYHEALTGGPGGGIVISGTTTGFKYQMRFFSPNGQVGYIKTDGSATAYVTSSDYRLKENVVPMTGSIDRVKALNPSRFNFIADADTTVDGFLAHEVQEIVPEAISGTKDAMMDEEYEVTAAVEEVRDEDDNVTTEAAEAVMGTRSVPDMQGIDQSKLVPLLVAALQEAIARIEILEGE